MAKHFFEAHVTAVCNTKNVELVQSLGADEVVDDPQENFARRARPTTSSSRQLKRIVRDGYESPDVRASSTISPGSNSPMRMRAASERLSSPSEGAKKMRAP
jgi:hypothetical protein